MNALYYLRTRNGLSMKALSEKTGVCTSDIMRIEHGSIRCSLSTFMKLAAYFAVPLEAILKNDVVAIYKYVKKNPEHISLNQMTQLGRNLGQMRSGNAGEDAVFEYELNRHFEAGGKYIQLIDPSVSEKTSNGFDVLSRTLDGQPLYIEAKSTKGGIKEPVYISDTELQKAEKLLKNGEHYMIYRVIYCSNLALREVIPMTLQDFYEKYVLKPDKYIATIKED